jgi:hypothetical protein
MKNNTAFLHLLKEMPLISYSDGILCSGTATLLSRLSKPIFNVLLPSTISIPTVSYMFYQNEKSLASPYQKLKEIVAVNIRPPPAII